MKSTPAIKCIGVLIIAALAWWIYAGSSSDIAVKIFKAASGISYASRDGVSPIISSKTAKPPAYALHVLFIGNSYTFVNDIPQQLIDIASADPGNPTQLFVQSVTRAGVTLKELWQDGKALAAIRDNHWDYVVLQEHSFWAITSIEASYGYMAHFNEEIRKSGAKTLIYLTWPRKPGSHWYTDGQTSFLRDPNYMLQKFIDHSYDIAKTLDAQVVPVGIDWMQALARQPGIELYQPDQHHPNTAGSFLSALVFYKTLTGRDVTQIPFKPSEVPEDTARTIKAVVQEPIQAR